MYWIGLQPGDVHLNISSPGWAKHAWSNVFAPWIAEACVLVMNYAKFDAAGVLDVLDRCQVTSFCAPPTVWRMLIQADLSVLANPPTKVVGAGEPLNPEVIEQVEKAWGVRIRDGFGQTESTVQIGNPPGQPIKPGSMGRPIPGYPIELIDPATGEQGRRGRDLHRPVPAPARADGRLPRRPRTQRRGDGRAATTTPATSAAATRDGYITYVGRADDVFKASDYRISPFELESVLIEHPAVAEAAIVPSPDPVRLAVPKAYVVLAAGHEPTAETARSILEFARDNLAPYKRVRRLEFADAAQDDLRQDPPGGASRPGSRAARRSRGVPDGRVHAVGRVHPRPHLSAGATALPRRPGPPRRRRHRHQRESRRLRLGPPRPVRSRSG